MKYGQNNHIIDQFIYEANGANFGYDDDGWIKPFGNILVLS